MKDDRFTADDDIPHIEAVQALAKAEKEISWLSPLGHDPPSVAGRDEPPRPSWRRKKGTVNSRTVECSSAGSNVHGVPASTPCDVPVVVGNTPNVSLMPE